MPKIVRINRAPVLTLWAAVVAQRLGFDRDEALTLGRAVAGLNAYSKGVSLGLFEPTPDAVREARKKGREGALTIDLLHRAVPAVMTPDGIRALAKERGVDLSALSGSGPDGTITRDDVMRTAGTQSRASEREPLRGVRLSMARNMAASRQSIVPATVFDEADIEAWWTPAADVTVRLIRAIVAACAAEPTLNGWFDGQAMTRELKSQVDLGIAVDTEAGLIVPVLRDVGGCDAPTLRRSLDALKEAVRARTVAPAALRGATITLSNFGTLAGRHASLVIVPPQMAIVGAGRIAPQAVPAPQGVAFHHFLPLSATFDHRVISGGEAARFMKAVIDDLARPA